MNIFILNSGRCGSVTFSEACSHISNFSSSHESNIDKPGFKRIYYPENHIEIDCRLIWFAGRLSQRFPRAKYVHLQREPTAVIRSFEKRAHKGIMRAFHKGIYLYLPDNTSPFLIAGDYLETVTKNIQEFLKDKDHMNFSLENYEKDFRTFWDWIGAQGDLERALKEFEIKYNAS